MRGTGMNATGTTGRADSRSSSRKSRILDKTEALFWKKGFSDTTISDIAKACGCRPANIYNYFQSKEDILYAVIDHITSRTVNLVKPLGEDENTNPAELLRAFIKAHFGFLAGMKQSIVSVTDAGLRELTPEHRKAIVALRRTYDDTLRKILKRGKESGDFADVDEKIVGYLIPSLIVRSNVWFSPKGRLSADEVSEAIFRLVYLGLKPRARSNGA